MAKQPVELKRMISAKDTIGYALGDASGQFTLSLVGIFLTMFYTDVLGISTKQIAVLMFFARLWDGINDPIWGAIVDRLKPSRYGRFRPWVLWGSVPVAFSAVMMFSNPGWGNLNIVWAYLGYIAFDMSYTVVNVSYGSLASVISPLENDRASLSVARSLGAGLGGLPAAILLPMFVFSKDAQGANYLDGRKMLTCVLVLAALSVVVAYASFAMTKERVAAKAEQKNPQLKKTFRALLHNRPFIMMCTASMLMIATQMYISPINSYLFKDYFRRPELITLFSVFTYLPMALLLPFLGKLARRFGKKEICTVGALFGAVAYALAFFIRTENVYLYLGLSFLSGLGLTFFIMEVWALATDTIDYQSLLSGQREEGTAYAIFSFTRKLGHTAAGSGSALLLGFIGYNGDLTVQSAGTISGMYTAATLVPAIAMFLLFITLAFGYPLGKAKLREMHEQMDARDIELGKINLDAKFD